MKKKLIVFCLSIIIPASAFGTETTLTPGITVKTEYTDNVNRFNDDPEYDFITSISPWITMGLSGKSAGANLTYAPSRVYYARTHDNKFWRHRVSADAFSQMTRRLRATIAGSYLQSEDPADNELVDNEINDFTIRRGRNKYYTYSANAGVNYQFGPKDHIGLHFYYGGTNNDDPTLEDSRYYRPTLDFAYWFTHTWGVELSGRYERGEFSDSDEGTTEDQNTVSDDFDRWFGTTRLIHQFNRHISGNLQYAMNRILYDGETEDERIHDISAGFDYQIESDKDLSVQLGYSIVERPGLDNETGLSSDINFTKNFRSGTLGLNFRSGYDYSYFRAENLGLNYYVGGGVNYNHELSQRMNADTYANYRYTEYKDTIPERNDDRYIAGIGLSYQVLRWLYVGAGYRFSAVASNIEGIDYTENRVYLSLTASPSRPYRLFD